MNTAETSAQPGWFCLRAQPRREFIAAANLRERVGLDVFAPRIRVSKSFGRHLVRALTEALFPGYLFARFQYPQQYRHVVSTPGVAGLVSFGGRPPPVADGIIDFLRAQVRLGEGAGAIPTLEPGAWVRIVHGCFRDVEGRIIQFDSRTDRVHLLLTLLGREVQVSVLAHEVAAAETRRACYPGALLASEPASAFTGP